MGLRITSRIKEWNTEAEHKLDMAFAELATTILRDAKVLAPVASGNLNASGQVKRVKSANYQITFGGDGRIPYARRRHFENRKNPQTLRYLERAGDANVRNIKRYLQGL